MTEIFTLEIGLKVSVPERGISGEVVAVRQNQDGSIDANIRYSVPFGRKPYYETWWPKSFLEKAE